MRGSYSRSCRYAYVHRTTGLLQFFLDNKSNSEKGKFEIKVGGRVIRWRGWLETLHGHVIHFTFRRPVVGSMRRGARPWRWTRSRKENIEEVKFSVVRGNLLFLFRIFPPVVRTHFVRALSFPPFVRFRLCDCDKNRFRHFETGRVELLQRVVFPLPARSNGSQRKHHRVRKMPQHSLLGISASGISPFPFVSVVVNVVNLMVFTWNHSYEGCGVDRRHLTHAHTHPPWSFHLLLDARKLPFSNLSCCLLGKSMLK